MPEEFSDSRRQFLGYAIAGIGGVIALGYAVPLASYLVEPSLKKVEEPWAVVADITELVTDVPRTFTFSTNVKIGWEEKKVEHDVWVVKRPDNTVTVFSPVCPHLGCGYHWDEDKKQFVCPCHASVYDIGGKVLAGPAPRALDTLPTRIEGGKLYVRYETFRLGVADKVTA